MKNKRKKVERIWLCSVIFFYICYNLPMIPKYGQQFPMLLHSLLTLVPLWISVYVGLICVCRLYPLRKKEKKS
ncbi:MAG: hypothetical protein Q4E53_01435 [Eubacteriales bacterium]|nr:hypothetical protein [Eubacteriales bacterium]